MHYQAASIYLLLNTDENNIPPLIPRSSTALRRSAISSPVVTTDFPFHCASNPNFLKVAIKNGILDIEKNGVENNIFRIVGTFKTDHWIFQFLKGINCHSV